MSNQTFVKKDRISFAQNLNEKSIIAPFSNAVFIGPNSAITYDGASNITSINTLQGVTLSNQYIYADGTYLSNIPTSGVIQNSITSSIEGLGTIGYVSSSQLVSSMNAVYGVYISAAVTLSSIQGFANYYFSTSTLLFSAQQLLEVFNESFTSTTTGLGTAGYISSSQLTSTVTGLSAGGGGSASNWSLYPAISTVDFSNNITSNNFVNFYNDLDNIGHPTALLNGLLSFYGYYSYYNSNTPYPIPIAADWWRFVANGYVDINNNDICNVNNIFANQLTLQTTTPYYANMNLTYSFGTFPDPMNGYSGLYEILNFDGQPFSMYNSAIDLFTLPNLYTLVFPDCNNNYNTYLYANSNDNDRFYYNVYNNTYNYTLSNRAIAQDWSYYGAEATLVLNNNPISEIYSLSGYGGYPIQVDSALDMCNYPLSNISSLGFYDVVTPSSNSVLHASNSLLYYNNSNEIIGGTLQYLPQLISFAPFSPSQIPYLGLWMDAADSNTFNLDSGYIYQWYDKSSNSNVFTTNGPYPLYTGSNVVFDGTFFMASTNPLTFDTNTYIFMVASINSTSFEMAFALNDINGGDYSLRYVSDGFHNADAGDALWPRYYANGYLNGTVDFTQTHIIDGVFNSSGTSIMRLSSDFMGRVFLGNMNEVIVYNGPTPLTSNQIAQVRTYLTAKWSIPAFNPTQIPNLALWLDGKDPNSFTISGGNILQWYDKSPNSNTFTPSYGDTAYLNGAVFTGTSILTSLASLTYDTNTYVFMVASLVVTGTGDLVRMSFATNGDYSMRYYSSYYAALGGGADILTTYNVNGTPFGTIDFTQTHIIDGAFSSSGASVMQLSSAVNGRFFTGSINEIIVYNGLTNDQIIQVRNYLANKWNITL